MGFLVLRCRQVLQQCGRLGAIYCRPMRTATDRPQIEGVQVLKLVISSLEEIVALGNLNHWRAVPEKLKYYTCDYEQDAALKSLKRRR